MLYAASSYVSVAPKVVLAIFYMSSEIQIIYIMDIILKKPFKRRIGLHVCQYGHGGGPNHRKRMSLKELHRDVLKVVVEDVKDLDTARNTINIIDGVHHDDGVFVVSFVL